MPFTISLHPTRPSTEVTGRALEREAATWLLSGFDAEAARSFERAAEAYQREGRPERAAMCTRMWAALSEVAKPGKGIYR